MLKSHLKINGKKYAKLTDSRLPLSSWANRF